MIVPSSFSKKEEWVRQPRYCDISVNINVINNCVTVHHLFKLVAQTFDLYVRFSQFGYTRLSQAEELALKTKDTFCNPHPFLVLEEEYRKVGNDSKATEMGMIAKKITL